MRTITFRTTTFTIYMMNRSLPKRTMNFTYYFNRIVDIFTIHSFRIIISISMYLHSFFYKFISCFSMSSKTFWTFVSMQMMCWSLPKFTVFWTYYTNFSFSVYILYFRIIIHIAILFLCFFYK